MTLTPPRPPARCPACHGAMFEDEDGPYCLSGHRPRKTLAELEREDAEAVSAVQRRRGHSPKSRGVKL